MQLTRSDTVDDFAAREIQKLRRDRRRLAAAWAVFGALSLGLHHLSLQFLDLAGVGRRDIGGPKTVLLDLFAPTPAERPPAQRPLARPPEPAKPPAAASPTDTAAAAESPKPETPAASAAAPPRRRPRVPRLPRAQPQDERRPDQLTLGGDSVEPYDPLQPRLRMSDWTSDRFAAADRYFEATGHGASRGLVPDTLRSPLERIGPWNDWGGDASVADAGDFFAATGDGINLALNPDRPDVLRYVPVDATVLAYLNLRAIQGGPHAEGVAALLRALPDYQSIAGHIEAQILDRADELYVASSDPTDRSKTVVIVRHHLGEDEIAALIGRQITLAGGKPDWSRLSDRAAVTVDRDHADATPWLYLLPEPGVLVVVHRANLTPVIAALDGQTGRGTQPQLVGQLRRLVGETPPADEARTGEPTAPPTLFAVADSGALGPHLRFLTRALTGAEIGQLGAGYLRITGGEHPQVLGGLRLPGPAEAPRWAELMRRIENQELAKTFDFSWAGRDDRVLFRFALTDPIVSSGLGVFRAWADRYYSSPNLPPLPEAAPADENIIGTAVRRPDADTDRDAAADAPEDRRKVEYDGTGPPKTDAGIATPADAPDAPDAGD